LQFALNGYVAQDYGQRVFPGSGTPIKLMAGQALDDLVVRLIPTGTVSGRLVDGNGQPLGNVRVQLMRSSYQHNGIEYLRQLHAEHETRTNDRGEFRLFFVTPGRYVLTAGTPPDNPGYDDDFGTPAGNRFKESVAFTNSGRTLNVRSGEELSGIEMTANTPRTFSIRGRVIDARSGAPPASVDIALVSGSDEYSRSRATYTAATGVFQFRDVPEGPYTVVAGVTPRQIFTGREQEQGSVEAFGSARVVLAGNDQEGIVLTLQSGAPLTGRVRVDGADSLNLERLRVWLLPTPDSIPAAANAMRILPEASVGATGTFQFAHVWDASYRLFFPDLPEGWYMKQARLGEQDVLGKPLHIDGAPQVALDIVVSSKTAEIQITALDANQKPVPGAQVVLIPAAGGRAGDSEFDTADASGRVTLRGVAPGDYMLVAWEAIETLAWLDPDVAREAAPSGKRITLAESANTTAEIRVIPAR